MILRTTMPTAKTTSNNPTTIVPCQPPTMIPTRATRIIPTTHLNHFNHLSEVIVTTFIREPGHPARPQILHHPIMPCDGKLSNFVEHSIFANTVCHGLCWWRYRPHSTL